jgi:hypothetical protein
MDDVAEMRERLAAAESQIRTIKRVIAILCLAMVVCLVPVLRLVFGFALFVVAIVGGVLLLISTTIMVLEWVSAMRESKVPSNDEGRRSSSEFRA